MVWSDNGTGGVAYLKDYGSYYRVTVCKGVVDYGSSWPEEDVAYMQGQMNCDKRTAVKLLDLLHYDYPAFQRMFSDLPHLDVAADEFTEKLGRWENNLSRARSTIEQLGNCNPWQYFVTFTIDPEKYDRYDFAAFYKVFSKFVMHYRQRKGVRFSYVFVPEQHRDGAWHLHGLINGLPEEHLRAFTLDETLPHYIRDKLRHGEKVYEWPAFAERFGYTVVELLKDPERAASYITKYIGKGFAHDNRFQNAKLFMPSHGLKRAQLLKKGFADMGSAKPSFECEYAATYKFPKSEYRYSDVVKYFV